MADDKTISVTVGHPYSKTSIDITLSETVADLKQHYNDKTGTPIEQQKLVVDGSPLRVLTDDSKTIRDSKIVDGSVIYVYQLIGPRSGKDDTVGRKVTFKDNATAKQVSVMITANLSVRDLRFIAAKNADMPPRDPQTLELELNGKTADLDSTLEDLKVPDGGTIIFVVKPVAPEGNDPAPGAAVAAASSSAAATPAAPSTSSCCVLS